MTLSVLSSHIRLHTESALLKFDFPNQNHLGLRNFTFHIRAVCPAHVFNCVILITCAEEYNLRSCHFVIISLLLFGPDLHLKILFPYSFTPLGQVMTSDEARMTDSIG